MLKPYVKKSKQALCAAASSNATENDNPIIADEKETVNIESSDASQVDALTRIKYKLKKRKTDKIDSIECSSDKFIEREDKSISDKKTGMFHRVARGISVKEAEQSLSIQKKHLMSLRKNKK